MTSSGTNRQAIEQFVIRQQRRFLENNPKSVALAGRARGNLFGDVPMHWMAANAPTVFCDHKCQSVWHTLILPLGL